MKTFVQAVSAAQSAANRTGRKMGVYPLGEGFNYGSESWIEGSTHVVSRWCYPKEPDKGFTQLVQIKEFVGDDEVLLEDWHYMVDMSIGGDTWRLSGKAWNHPNFTSGMLICVSTPKFLDREKRIVITASGRNYRLGNCSGNEDEQFKYIREDIDRKGTLVI